MRQGIAVGFPGGTYEQLFYVADVDAAGPALDGELQGPHQYIYLIEDLPDYQHYVAAGRELYYLPGVDLYESQAHDLQLAELGARELGVPRERQRPASSGE